MIRNVLPPPCCYSSSSCVCVHGVPVVQGGVYWYWCHFDVYVWDVLRVRRLPRVAARLPRAPGLAEELVAVGLTRLPPG